MLISQIHSTFHNKEHAPCPLTEKLVKSGYQQRDGGYIKRAKQSGIEVDYTKNMPSQYWHLMTYCNSQPKDKAFSKSIVCGELIFWMAEVLQCVPYQDLNSLLEQIVASKKTDDNGKIFYNRKFWNKKIQDLCFDKIEGYFGLEC